MTPTERFTPPICQDYNVAHFDGVALSLFEVFRANLMATRQPIIENKTFTGCVIEGPAILLALAGVNFDGCNLGVRGDDPRSLLVMPMAKNRVTGAIGVRNCLFKDCTFFAVGYTGPDAFIDQMIQVLDASAKTRDAGE
ncbi:hypothetical protein [Brevundimonas aveniformis]|uniref:hypothetical protein n=1 Tax=Brevundimonas aveniformis TaxID=370977 RepID=UPI0004223F46|nr:hypothetical protein [Brevundimonas aveniformis]